jgi:hypothetical protein
VRFTDPKRLVYEGWVLYRNPGSVHGDMPKAPRVTVQYWSSLRCAWLTEQFTPEQLTPAPELATDDPPGRPA